MFDRFEKFSLAISEISRHWHKLTTEEMEKYDLKGPHSVYLLAMAHYSDGVTAPQICEFCGKDKADVSRMMNILEKKGLVKKEAVYQNLYRGVFKLTDEGKEVADFVKRRTSLAVEIAGRDLTEEEREIFYKALDSITKNLRELNKEGLPKDE